MLIQNHKIKIFILSIFFNSFFSLLLADESTKPDKQQKKYSYFYNGIDFNLNFDDQRMIHLSLPADEYIMRMRSKGDVDVVIYPKDRNILNGNIFVRQCDAAIITTNANKSVARTPICISGNLFKVRLERSQSKKSKKNTYGAKKENSKRRIIYKYYIDTITEQLIEIKGINHDIHDKVIRISKEKEEKKEISICGYYNILNDTPYIEVHWIEPRDSFVQMLQQNSLLKNGPWGLW